MNSPFWIRSDVPEDVIFEIIIHLPKVERLKLSLVSKTFRKCCFKLLEDVSTEGKFNSACKSGDLLSLMINRTKISRYVNWNRGLRSGCKYDNLSMVKLAISKGADDWYEALYAILKRDVNETVGSQRVRQLINEKCENLKNSDLEHDQMVRKKCLSIEVENIRFIKACKDGNVEIVKELNVKGPLLNAGFIKACIKGHVEVVKFLMIEVKERPLRMGLFEAAAANRIEVVEFLIKNGIKNLNYGLHGAIKGGNIYILKFMIRLCAGDIGQAIYNACEYGRINIFRLLIDTKPGHLDWNEALFRSCRSGNFDLVKLIVDLGGTTCFIWESGLCDACAGGNISIVKFILEKGCYNLSGGLSIACLRGHIEIIKFLIKLSEGSDEYICDLNRGLIGACRGLQGEAAEFMIEKGANNFNECLLKLCTKGHLEMVKLMIEKGANNWSEALYESIGAYVYNVSKYIVDKFDDIDELSSILDRYAHNFGTEIYKSDIGKYILDKISIGKILNKKVYIIGT